MYLSSIIVTIDPVHSVIVDLVLDCIRKLADNCTGLQGFLLFNAVARRQERGIRQPVSRLPHMLRSEMHGAQHDLLRACCLLDCSCDCQSALSWYSV